MKQILLLLLFPFFFSAQIKEVVLDTISGKPIAYVNLWVENENIGTTSEENSVFIVFEKLLIKENKFCFERKYKNSSKVKSIMKGCSYEPNLAYIPSEKNNVLYANNTLNWTKRDKVKLDKPKSYENLLMRKYHDKYLVPSIEITLTN